MSSTNPSAKADALTEGSAAADASGVSPATADVATLLNQAQQATGAALKALERSDQAQRDAMAPLRELHLRVAQDEAAFREMLKAAGVELTKKLDQNRALAAVKAAAPTMDDKHASFLARVLNGLEARGVAAGDAPAFIAENGGMVAVEPYRVSRQLYWARPFAWPLATWVGTVDMPLRPEAGAWTTRCVAHISTATAVAAGRWFCMADARREPIHGWRQRADSRCRTRAWR